MVELLVSHYLVVTYTLAHAVSLDTRLLLTCYYFTMHYICDVMLGGGLFVSG